MKAKYCPCLGVKLFGVDRDDIGQDFGSVEPRITGGSDEDTPAPIWMQPGRHANLFLEEQWQLMGALEALNGMLLFGLTTAFLFAMIQKVWPLGSRG
jgi:hypothetical protein